MNSIDKHTGFWKTLAMTTLLLSAACGDGTVNLETERSNQGDSETGTDTDTTSSDPGETDTGTATDTSPSGDTETDTESDTPVEIFTVKMQAENYDTLDAGSGVHGWYVVSTDSDPGVLPDPDPSHAATANQDAYMEALPDNDTDASSVVFEPTDAPKVGYNVQLEVPGRYYVWVRAYTTGDADNRLHVGMDGGWPNSGRNIQLPDGSNAWSWSASQADSGGTIYLDVDTPGVHHVSFAMGEDGFEFDEWIMTTDGTMVP